MTKIKKAVASMEGLIGEELRIGGKNIPAEKIYQQCILMGKKRKYKEIDEYRIECSNKSYLLPVSNNSLKQWQTIGYYSIISEIYLDDLTRNSHFLDLDLLVTKDGSLIDDMHNSMALLQTPDLPYKDIERSEYFILPDGSYDKDIDNIVDYVREKIDQGYYVAIELDDYYIKNRKYHSVLRSFVYGYDDKNKEFYCLGFVERIFKKYAVKYSTFVQGYEYGKLINLQAPIFLELYRPNQNVGFEGDEEKLIENKLKSYFNSTNQYNILQGESKSGRWGNCNEYVGFKASVKFVELLETMIVDAKKKVCYQCMHAFYEHKKKLYESAQQIKTKNDIDLLKKATEDVNIARLLFLKYDANGKLEDLQKCIRHCRRVLEYEEQFANKNGLV